MLQVLAAIISNPGQFDLLLSQSIFNYDCFLTEKLAFHLLFDNHFK
jgi:hypothetical protein